LPPAWFLALAPVQVLSSAKLFERLDLALGDAKIRE
jgi:hypothetical protein